MAAYAEIAEGEDGPELFLRASVTAIDGSDAVRLSATGRRPPTADRGAAGGSAAELLADRRTIEQDQEHAMMTRSRASTPAGSSSSVQDRVTPAC